MPALWAPHPSRDWWQKGAAFTLLRLQQQQQQLEEEEEALAGSRAWLPQWRSPPSKALQQGTGAGKITARSCIHGLRRRAQ